VRSPSAEDVLPKWLGRAKPLKGLWVRVTDDLKYLGPDGGHLVLCCDSEEGRDCGKIRNFMPFGESRGERMSVEGSINVRAEQRTQGGISS